MFRLKGFDTFAGEYYDLAGEYETREEAEKAAAKRLEKLEETQPESSSGGQSWSGIQDRVYLVNPDGKLQRIL